MKNKKKIKKPKVSDGNPLPVPNFSKKSQPLCFNFKEYQHESIIIHDFNNCYFNNEEHEKVMNDTVKTLSHLSNHIDLETVKQEQNMRCHTINGQEQVNLTKKVLTEYGFKPEKIEDMFLNEIYQIQVCSKPPTRLIFRCIESVIYPLFNDTNHQINKDKKRGYDNNLKSKKYYKK